MRKKYEVKYCQIIIKKKKRKKHKIIDLTNRTRKTSIEKFNSEGSCTGTWQSEALDENEEKKSS